MHLAIPMFFSRRAQFMPTMRMRRRRIIHAAQELNAFEVSKFCRRRKNARSK